VKQITETQEPITVDVKWVQTHHMLKTGLQSKLRAIWGRHWTWMG